MGTLGQLEWYHRCRGWFHGGRATEGGSRNHLWAAIAVNLAKQLTARVWEDKADFLERVSGAH